MSKIMFMDNEYTGNFIKEPTVYKAAWTATSSSGFTAVTETLNLPAGIYMGIIKIPVCSQKTSLAFGLVPTPSDFSTGGMLAVDQGILTFEFTLDTPTSIYVNSQMSTATTYTYIERGYFKAIRIRETRTTNKYLNVITGTPSITGTNTANYCTLTKVGNVVEFNFAVNFSLNLPAGTNTKVGTIPEGFRPVNEVSVGGYILGGTYGFAYVKPNGDIELQRVAAGTSNLLRQHLVWITNQDVEPAADIEYVTGTSGIWTYRKWSDGTAECWGRTAAKSYAVTSAYVNGWYANLDRVTFPTGLFVNAPIVNATRGETGGATALLFPSLHTIDSTGFGGYIGSISSGTYTLTLSVMATGRWK